MEKQSGQPQEGYPSCPPPTLAPCSSEGTMDTSDDDGDDMLADEYTLMMGSSVESSSPGQQHGGCGKHERLLRQWRVLEFACTLVMFGLALFFACIPVQQLPTWAVVTYGTGVPVVTNLLMNYALPSIRSVRLIPHDTRDFLLTLAQSASMAELLTEFTKNLTGRFRPSFYAMCGWQYDVLWDGVTNLCTNAAGEKEGRKSFPSGHASFAWSTMLVLTVRCDLDPEALACSALMTP
ncbi:hypothetical protein BBJ28_00014987 [Nothophytophthora sp. Chile5]|nr:hypothetical protein BBJ28_00014987 [Nothophytophthora sp. Chile5]